MHSLVRDPKDDHAGGMRGTAAQRRAMAAEAVNASGSAAEPDVASSSVVTGEPIVVESSEDESVLSAVSSGSDSPSDPSGDWPSESSSSGLAATFDDAAYRPPKRRRTRA